MVDGRAGRTHGRHHGQRRQIRQIAPPGREEARAMTRENKVGLVVASSFLALVGIVLAVKLREPARTEEASPRESSPVAAATPPPMSVSPAAKLEAKDGTVSPKPVEVSSVVAIP